ncbi:uncharacterized protein LOC144444386 [Glandiceps talaboti]
MERQMYQYTCLPNGLTSAPRLFTKLLKPVYATLREMGHLNVGYIDDSYLQGDTYNECKTNVSDTNELFLKLGFLVNLEKSVFEPSQTVTFLGFKLNSVLMLVTPTAEKTVKLKQACTSLMAKHWPTIRDVAEVIGLIVSNFPGAQYGPLHYRSLEIDKTEALKAKAGNFDARMALSDLSKKDLQWWIENIDTANCPVSHRLPNIVMQSDASLKGWGACRSHKSTGGRWTLEESRHHINYLEILAALYALQSLCSKEQNIHIQLQMDNTTAVAYVNAMGGTKSTACNNIVVKMWEWCIARQIWISATYLPGAENIEADTASRQFNDNIEWMLQPTIFNKIVDIWGNPDIDLFASRLNKQLPTYIAWKPDPGAEHIDAMSLDWANYFFYAFPPFSMLMQCVQKIEEDKAHGILIAPLWPTQAWYSKMLQLLVDKPKLLPVTNRTLQLVHKPTALHPLRQKLQLIACKLSGNLSDSNTFLTRQPTLSCYHGGKGQRNNMQHILKNGKYSVVRQRLMFFDRL